MKEYSEDDLGKMSLEKLRLLIGSGISGDYYKLVYQIYMEKKFRGDRY